MKDLYFCLCVLCFLVLIMLYCVKKSIIAIKELKQAYSEHKKISKELLDVISKEN